MANEILVKIQGVYRTFSLGTSVNVGGASGADAVPSTPNAWDDEFDSDTISPDWDLTHLTNSSLVLNGKRLGIKSLVADGALEEHRWIQKPMPVEPWGIITKLSLPINTVGNYLAAGIITGNETDTEFYAGNKMFVYPSYRITSNKGTRATRAYSASFGGLNLSTNTPLPTSTYLIMERLELSGIMKLRLSISVNGLDFEVVETTNESTLFTSPVTWAGLHVWPHGSAADYTASFEYVRRIY